MKNKQTDGVNFLRDLTKKVNKPPKTDEYEVSIFGRGYGESIVLSCGNREFIVIDSFINPDSGRPIALDYLDCMNIPYEKIKMVIITHWHDDHIKGISEIVKAAGKDVCMVLNPIIKDKDFLNVILRAISESENNGVSEFRKVWECIEGHEIEIKFSIADKRIFSDEENDSAELYGLAPQDSEILDYIKSFITRNESNLNISSYYQSDNDLSLVLLLKKNGYGALLGGDLENSNDNSRGWNAIVNNYSHKSTHPNIYKVPHHGSKTAFNEKIWTEILDKKPISVITVFNRNKKLPDDEEIQKMMKLSKKVYIVGGTQKDKAFSHKVKKSAPQVKIESEKLVVGMFRYRKNISNGTDSIEHFGYVKVREEESDNNT